MMASSNPLDIIISFLNDLGETRSSVAQAADTAVKVSTTTVKTNKAAFKQLGADVIELTYVIEGKLWERGQSNNDDKLKRDIDEYTGLLEKILELAQKNAATSRFKAMFWSDKGQLRKLREELERQLQVFGLRSITDLHYKATKRTNDMNNSMSPLSNVTHQRDKIVPPPRPPTEMLAGASGFTITGGEFNNIGGTYHKTSNNVEDVSTAY